MIEFLKSITDFIISNVLFLFLPLFFGPALAAIAFRFSLPMELHSMLIGICLLFGLSPFFVANASLFAVVTIPSSFFGLLGLLAALNKRLQELERSSHNQHQTVSKFYRSRRRLIAGICGTFAKRSKSSVWAVRITIIALSIIFPSIFPLLYLWLWLAFPLEPISNKTHS
jgi:phage shock protein PspC (stress-responsive transcriptional regulator)